MSKLRLPTDTAICGLTVDLPLIKNKEVEGYESRALSKWMADHHLLESWREFIHGSTGAIIDDQFIVYRWDVESFLAGEPNLD